MATFELREGDLVDGFAAHRRRHKGWRLFFLFSSILFVAIGLFILSPLCQSRQIGLVGWMFLAAGIYLGVVNVVLLPLLVRRQARRVLLQNKLMQGERTCTWTDTAITIQTRYGVNTFPWTDFQSCLEGKEVFMLYTSPRQFTLVPKRALTETEVVDLRRILGKAQYSRAE